MLIKARARQKLDTRNSRPESKQTEKTKFRGNTETLPRISMLPESKTSADIDCVSENDLELGLALEKIPGEFKNWSLRVNQKITEQMGITRELKLLMKVGKKGNWNLYLVIVRT